MNDRLTRAGLVVVALAGIGVATYLTYVHYRPGALICTGSGGCEDVQDSEYAVLAGIPVAILGIVLWGGVLTLALRTSELARILLVAVALGALGFAVYLVILQLLVIDAICIWCMVNDVVLVPLLTVLALLRFRSAPDARRPA